MRVLVLGGTGMLGHKMHQVLARDHEVVSTTRGAFGDRPYAKSEIFREGRVIEHVDATDEEAVSKLLADLAPEVLVNCVGIVKQRDAAHDPTTSIRVNALLPHRLAALASQRDARLIHFSTDCVFSGDRGDYTEADESDARDLYGRTKYLGEVRSGGLTLRTSIIGRELEHFQSLVEWFLRQDGRVTGFRRAIYTGLTTLELSRIVGRLIAEHPGLEGLYQVASAKISKYDLLASIRDVLDLDVTIEPDDGFVCDRSLRGDAFTEATGIRVPPWREMLEGFAADASVYRRWET